MKFPPKAVRKNILNFQYDPFLELEDVEPKRITVTDALAASTA
jgi:hypothetical protein